MTKKELFQQFKGVPDDARIVLAVDPEGNEFRDLNDVSEGCFVEYQDGIGDFTTEADPEGAGVPAVCLWP